MTLLDFLNTSPTAIQAVENMRQLLFKAGAQELKEGDAWELCQGKTYFLVRNDSALMAFRIPEKPAAFRVFAAHNDSPSFKIKENPEIVTENYVKLNVEKYGGMLMAPWFDRPLSVAGRVLYRQGDEVLSKPVNVDRDLLIIPSLAIHMNRNVNDGYAYNAQKDLLPLFGTLERKGTFMKTVAEAAGLSEAAILGHDLYLYIREPGKIWGPDQEFITAPHLDDLQCVFAGLQGFLKEASGDGISVLAFFDNEEVGSASRQGAASTFLSDVLERIGESLGLSRSDFCRMISRSFMLSADNGHAVHPNYPEKADPTNRPYLNQGVLLKYSANQRYTTDGYSAALFKTLCQKADIPFQIFHNRSDMLGGSTLGNLSILQVPFPTADIGLPILAMHSVMETGGMKDYEALEKVAEEFFA